MALIDGVIPAVTLQKAASVPCSCRAHEREATTSALLASLLSFIFSWACCDQQHSTAPGPGFASTRKFAAPRSASAATRSNPKAIPNSTDMSEPSVPGSSKGKANTAGKPLTTHDIDGHDLPPSPAPSTPRNGRKYALMTELVYTESNDQYNASSVPIYQVCGCFHLRVWALTVAVCDLQAELGHRWRRRV
jgi:hypothetical protein